MKSLGNQNQAVMGLVGHSGSGKTTLLTMLLPILIGRGYSVSTIKHTHHDFDMDHPGKDSFRHREAGAVEVLLTSENRWALLHELREQPELDMPALISRMTPVDLLMVEGFKGYDYPKIEIYRPSLKKELLAPGDQSIIAVATDESDHSAVRSSGILVLDLGQKETIADFVISTLNLSKNSQV